MCCALRIILLYYVFYSINQIDDVVIGIASLPGMLSTLCEICISTCG